MAMKFMQTAEQNKKNINKEQKKALIAQIQGEQESDYASVDSEQEQSGLFNAQSEFMGATKTPQPKLDTEKVLETAKNIFQ